MRRQLATTPAPELARSYLDDYAQEDADIRALSPPSVHDDRARNVLVVTESYETASFWKGGRRELRAWEVIEQLPARVRAARTTPLAVPHPVHVRHEIVVRAGAPFRLGRFGSTIDGQAFAFASSMSAARNELRLAFTYRSRTDALLPGQVKAEMQALERVERAASFVLLPDLTSPDAPEDGWEPATLVSGGSVLALAAVAAAAAGLRARRRRRQGSPEVRR